MFCPTRALRDKFEDLGLGLHEPHLAGDMALVELVAHPLGLDRFHNGAVAVDPDLLGSEDGLVEGINKSLPVDRDGALFLLSTIRGALKSGLTIMAPNGLPLSSRPSSRTLPVLLSSTTRNFAPNSLRYLPA